MCVCKIDLAYGVVKLRLVSWIFWREHHDGGSSLALYVGTIWSSSRIGTSGSVCLEKNKDKGFFEGCMDFKLHFAVFISNYAPSVL